MHTILRSIGLAPFRSESGLFKYDAQRNLQGRTHYVDDSTLLYFKSRITFADIAHDGLTYWLVESVGSKPDDIPGGHFRFVAFDVDGTVLSDRGAWYRSTAAAEKAGRAWLATHDATAHTRALLLARAARTRAEAERIESHLAK